MQRSKHVPFPLILAVVLFAPWFLLEMLTLPSLL
jgi:hypothetical protein